MATMIWPLRRATEVASDGVAVRCGAVRLTYAETWDRCRRLIGGLRQLGVGEGDRVAVLGANCHRFLELYQAIPGSGMVIVPLNQRHTAAELRYALEDSGTRVVFSGRDIEGPPGGVEHVIDLGPGYEELLAGGPAADFPDDLSENALAGLFYTGGTTGASKGVMLTHRNLIANALHFQAFCPFNPDTRWLIVAPLFHAAGSIAVLATVWNAGQQVQSGPDRQPGAQLARPHENAMSAARVASVREVTHTLMRDLGLTTVFGNPGSTELRFFKDWPEDFRYVLGLQESSVVAMADGYAQATGRAAFVKLHPAVGVGHAMGSVFRLPITFVVLNNRGYAALKAFGRVMGLEQPPGVDLPGIGIPEIAAGFGCPASRVDRADQLEPALRSSFASGGPTLVDVGVDSAIESLY